jgi:hypothetical protein
MGVPHLGGFSAEGLPRVSADALSPAQTTYLYWPVDLTFTQDGTAYYPDYNNHRVRRVDPDGTVWTVSGTGFEGDGPNDFSATATECWDGCDAAASGWNHPTDVVPDPAAPDQLWVAAWHNSRLDVIDTAAGTMTWAVGTGERGYDDGSGDANGNGDPLDDAVLDLPSSLAFGDDGTLYFSDQANQVVRKVTPWGTVEVVAGEPLVAGYDGDGGPATEAHLHGFEEQQSDPASKLALAGHTLYVADTVNHVVRTIDLDTGTIDGFAGDHAEGYAGDGGIATGATLNTPRDVAVGVDGEVYVADTGNHCVRVIRDDTIERFAGVCDPDPDAGAFSGDGGPALDAEFDKIYGVAVDAEGNVYLADTLNQVVRRVKH